jgi:pyruvate dehydrogenase E2 component (dihydrolipoamide acetyltransferase)
MPISRGVGVEKVQLGDGRRLQVRTWPGRGRPLVLLHGLLDDSEGWAQLAADTHRPCVAIDLPGFGGSSLPTRPRISAYAEDVVEGLRRLGVDSCTLVGHSLGGAVATAVAERSDAVHSLVLLAPAGYGRIRIAEAVTLPGVISVAEHALPLGLVNPLVVTGAYATFVSHRHLPSRDLVDRLRRRAFRSGPGVRAAAVAIAAAGRSENRFSNRRIPFDGPVAALWGSRDGLVDPAHSEAVGYAFPYAHVEVWRGMGHHPQRERPLELSRFIEESASRDRRRSARRSIPRAA